MLIDIYNRKKKFLKEYEYFCFHNCFKQILDFYEVDNSECYIDTSLGMKIKNRRIIKNDTVKIIYDIDKTSLLKPFDKYVIQHNPIADKLDKGFDVLKARIDEGVPIVTSVDVYNLPYLPYYNQYNSIHSIIMCGYDGDDINVVDWYEPYYYCGTVSEKKYMLARYSENPIGMFVSSGYDIDGKWIEILNHVRNGNIKDMLIETINNVIQKYYEPIDNKDAEYLYGVNVLNELFELFVEYRGKCENEIKVFLETVHRETFYIPKYKMFLARYIERSLEKQNKLKKYNENVVVLKELVDQWEKFLRFVIKCSVAYSDTLYEKNMDFLKKMIRDENQNYDNLLLIRNSI